jgi:SAM-dependent methyltransferase
MPTAKAADKHALYQLAVQDPAAEIRFINRVFKGHHARLPLTLREDFCGTAHLCASWVASHAARTAVGIDQDAEVLAWGKRHNLSSLGEAGMRVKLLRRDVRSRVPGTFDVAVAYNSSYWVFKTRTSMRAYFASVHRSLRRGGLFFLDCHGGFTGQEPLIERRRIPGGFTFVWQQGPFNPIDHLVMNHIHFEFPDKSRLNRAFSYQWRYWSLPEVRELLGEAGFRNSTVYWEGPGRDGRGDGKFKPAKVVRNEPAWVAYVVAER